MITASSDVTEMARMFCGGWLGTGEQERKGHISYQKHASAVIWMDSISLNSIEKVCLLRDEKIHLTP